VEDLEMKIKTGVAKLPKILTIDIETSPAIAYTWAQNMYETGLIKIKEPGKIISYSAKWLKGKQQTRGLIDYKGYKPNKVDDGKIVKDIHSLLDEADVVVTQNGVAFDSKYITTRIIAHNLPPPSPYRNIDTKQEAKKLLHLPSRSLDNLGKYFGLGAKQEHEGFPLWEKCMAGDAKAWERMKKYNAQDVRLTEALYLKLRPFMKSHPNFSTLKEIEACPRCTSTSAQRRGYTFTNASKYQRYQCNDCHGWYRGAKSIKISPKAGQGI
jgi:DNA polymerase elongation subunit (family B)